MAMKRKRSKSRSLLAYAVFVVVILAGGYGLSHAGYTDNPFDEVAFLSHWTSGGEQQFSQDFVAPAGATALALPSSSASASNGIDLTSLSQSGSTFQLPAARGGDGDSDEDSSAVQLPSASAGAASSAFSLPSADQLGSATASASGASVQGSGFDATLSFDQNTVDWSDIGDVLYDLWFICATTAVFIVVQQVFKFTVKQIRKSRLPAVAAA
jgi:hypothetical protein